MNDPLYRFLDIISDSYGIVDCQKRLVYFNEPYEKFCLKIYNTKPKLGECVLSVVKGKDDIDKAEKLWDTALSGKAFKVEETFGFGKNGIKFILEFLPLNIGDCTCTESCGKGVGLISKILDNEKNLKYQKVIDNLGEAVISINKNGIIQDFNKAAEKIFGYTASEIIGIENVNILMPKEIAQKHDHYIDRFYKTRDYNVIGKIRYVQAKRRNGELFEAELSISRISENSFTGVIRDLSNLMEKKTKIQQLEAANTIKNDYLSRMSHELRTPLNAIIGFSQLISMSEEKHKEYSKLILKSGKHLLTLIEDILNISKIENHSMSYSLERVCLKNVILDSIEMVQGMCETKNIQINYNPKNVEKFVLADYQKLKQVILNLFTNGIKYNTPNGMINVNTKESNDSLYISFVDTGKGLTESQINNLYIPFERLGAENTQIDGTGLGLVLCKSLIEGMGGKITVKSDGKNRGSCFTVVLKLIKDHDTLKVLNKMKRRDSFFKTNKYHTSKNDPQLTVLYIEDNISNFYLVENILNVKKNINLLSAIQGRVGLEIAKHNQPNLILLDLHLPDMHGKEVLKILKDDPKMKSIPVIILSADASKKNITELKELGAYEYLSKPIDIYSLISVIDNLEI